jgi:hypothetical protein
MTEKLGMLCVSPLCTRAHVPLRARAYFVDQFDRRPCVLVGKSDPAQWSRDGSGFPLDTQKTKTEIVARTSLAASDAPIETGVKKLSLTSGALCLFAVTSRSLKENESQSLHRVKVLHAV